jgi:uncharacterized protein YecA (UPF0149 family)
MQIDTRAIVDLAMLAQHAHNSRYNSRRERTAPMILAPTQKQLVRKRIGRNDPCPCGSGRKFKRCCHRSTEAVA